MDVEKLESMIRTLLREEIAKSRSQPEIDKLYTIAETCEILKLSDSTVRRKAKEGSLPYYQQGNGPLMFRHSDIQYFLSANRRTSRRASLN